MKFTRLFKMLPAVALICTAGAATADPIYDANVTSDVIFGSGNANGGFTVSRSNGVEIGLRGKLRFDENNQPQNTFNSDGAGTYTFQAGNPPTGFGFDPNSPTTPVWNFEWSINTDFEGTTGKKLNDFNYFMTFDVDPGPGTITQGPITNYLDPINLPYADHAIGDNSTGNGDGSVAVDASEYSNLIDANNLAQNSWSYEFFNTQSNDFTAPFDPNVPGSYLISLTAFDKDGSFAASNSINIEVTSVPEPATLALMGLGLLGLGLSRRKA